MLYEVITLVEQNEVKGILTRQSTLQLENIICRANGTGLACAGQELTKEC